MSGKVVFFDLETGGLDSQRHPIIELAAVACDDQGFEPIEEFHQRVAFDPRRADPEALRINNYDAELWRDAIPERDLVATFSRFLRSHATLQMISKAGRPYQVARLGGHNAASFDFAFLRSVFERNNAFLPAAFMVLDTLQLALWTFYRQGDAAGPENLKLETLVRHFQVERAGEAHSALSDVHATIAVVRRLLARAA